MSIEQNTDPIALALRTLANASREEWALSVQYMDGCDERVESVHSLADALVQLACTVASDISAVAEGEKKEADRSLGEHQTEMYANAFASCIIAKQAEIYADAVHDAHGRWEELLEQLQQVPNDMTEEQFDDALESL